LTIDEVEINKNIVELSKKYFFASEDERKNVIVADGVEYLTNKQFESEEDKYNFIIVDVNAGERCICPPEAFREVKYVEKMYESLKDKGMALLNVIAYNEKQLEETIENYKKKFDV